MKVSAGPARWLFIIGGAALVSALLLAFLPLRIDSREEVFEIPKGTWAQRMSGDQVSILPDQIYLALGVRDLLVLRNLDEVPQMFGPTLIMPGQSFKLPFELASEYDFACTAHASGQMRVVVDPEPTPGWQRLRWRVKNVFR
ncbi:MAG TPA: hypothetical protein VLC79_09025 [Cellvibrio sp.]|nr:hypothetical protein [Cellvibrio sp.]